MRQVPNWDEWFLSIAHVISTKSKDPHTQVGCILVNPSSKAIISTGYNGMITGMTETDALWERPQKYDYVCHAEANALSLAARHGVSVEGCSSYCTHFPCLACFKLLTQAGIWKFVMPKDSVALGAVEDREKIYKILHELPEISMEVL